MTEAPPRAHPIGAIIAGIDAGAVAGFVVGGIGSRLAMRILALTSPDARGAMTDAQEVVGEISLGGTLFLLVAGTALGVGGGLLYVTLRRWLPLWGTGLAFGFLLLAMFGRLLVEPDNIDFDILDPAWLGIVLFASLPVLFGLLVVPLQARFEPFFAKPRSRETTVLLYALGVAPLALGGPVALVIVTLIAVGFVLARSAVVREAWNAYAVDLFGRAVLLATGVFGLAAFSWGALEILI